MLSSLGLLDPPSRPVRRAMEASAFPVALWDEGEHAARPASGQLPGQAVPLGSVFGIKLFTDGVIVASLSDIYTTDGLCCPAADAGIKPGDYLLEADGRTVSGNASLARMIGGSNGDTVTLTVRRGDEIFQTDVTPVFGGGSFKTGMWIRDSAAGIGTLTFYDPATGGFAGLGHGVCDTDAGGVMSLKSGQPAPITLCGVDKGVVESPGQLRGYFSDDSALGRLTANNETGLYGVLDRPPAGEAVDILPQDKVVCGPVQILATVDEAGPVLYDGEILRVSSQDRRTRNLVVKITDPRLLTATGGIVQGMSGCPILQNGKLAGAVTHVFTDDPAMGYGIFAQTMWEELVVSVE